jgi:Family of unknown function (DUF6011)
METPDPASFDGLDDLDTAPVADAPKTFLDAQAKAAATVAPVTCYACRGTGTFVSKFTGRPVGRCFTCKGTGQIAARTAKAHATKKANESAALKAQADWGAAHSDVLAWVRSNDGRNSFATSLSNQLGSRGTLSERQVAAVREGLAKLARAVIAAEPSGTGLDLSKLPEGYYAVPQGDTRLKVRIDKPGPPSKWAGFIFVSDGAEYGQAKRYGRQAPGRTYTGDIVPQLRAILADPVAACAAYGHLVGRCGVCGRKLEDAESVARGIGPICFGKFA